MATENKASSGLLFRLIAGIFVPILAAFFILGCILFLNINFGAFQFPSVRGLWSNSMSELGVASLKESTSALNKLGEEIIRQKAEDVAKQMEIYVRAYKKKPSFEVLRNDPVMKQLAVQKVGKTGYTAVHDSAGINYFHSNPKIVGTDLHDLATKLPAFWNIVEGAFKAQGYGSYYDWRDPDGRIRPKYMYIMPIKDTDLFVAATTYIDEFSKPAQAITTKINTMQKTYAEQYNRRFGIIVIILAAVLVILLAVIFVYSSSVVGPIKKLSDVADRISMGDLKAAIEVKGKGEIAVLAESIERMQTSVQAAIERLQKRR